MTVTRGSAAARKRDIVARLECIVSELEGFEPDLAEVIPLAQYATYCTAVARLRRLAGRLDTGRAPGSGEVPASAGSGQAGNRQG
jgi:hypothetical protein